jgi:hypothetical protein
LELIGSSGNPPGGSSGYLIWGGDNLEQKFEIGTSIPQDYEATADYAKSAAGTNLRSSAPAIIAALNKLTVL